MATTFEPRQTLWSQLEMRTSAGEVEQLRRAVGAEHVQANEDAAAEVRSLLRVWADFRAASDAEVSAMRPAAPASLLPEPPNQREWLATQIRFHVENFRQASRETSGAADTDSMIPVETPRDRAVLRYVCGDGKRGQRPMSAPSAKGGVVLVDTRNVSSARPATSSRGIRSALSLVSDPNAIEELRQSLADERRALLADAEYLRGCIEQETAFHRRAMKAAKDGEDEPALAELREFNAKLEKAWLAGVGNRRRTSSSTSSVLQQPVPKQRGGAKPAPLEKLPHHRK